MQQSVNNTGGNRRTSLKHSRSPRQPSASGWRRRKRTEWRHTAKLIRSYLRERRDVGPYLFTGRKGPLQKRQVQKLFTDYTKAAGIRERSVHALRHAMAVHLLEAGRGIEYVADHLGHKNIQNTRIYAQITHPLREQVFRELEQHPKIVRLS